MPSESLQMKEGGSFPLRFPLYLGMTLTNDEPDSPPPSFKPVSLFSRLWTFIEGINVSSDIINSFLKTFSHQSEEITSMESGTALRLDLLLLHFCLIEFNMFVFF